MSNTRVAWIGLWGSNSLLTPDMIILRVEWVVLSSRPSFHQDFFKYRNEFSLIGWTEKWPSNGLTLKKYLYVERLKRDLSLKQKKDHFLCLHVKFHNVFRCSCSRELRRTYTKHIRTAITEIYLLCTHVCGVGMVVYCASSGKKGMHLVSMRAARWLQSAAVRMGCVSLETETSA